jgi:uncharacterized integral membrane protein
MLQAKPIVMAALIFLVLIVVFQNAAPMIVRVVAAKATMPLALLPGVVLAGGAICGLIGALGISAKAGRGGTGRPATHVAS